MKCKKCGCKLYEEYLGVENRKKQMCSPCLMADEVAKSRKERMELNYPKGFPYR